MSMDWLIPSLGAGVSAIAAGLTLFRLVRFRRSEKYLVEVLKQDKRWQALLTQEALTSNTLNEEQRKILSTYLLKSMQENLAKNERAPLYEGLTQDSSMGQAAYLVKLAKESAASHEVLAVTP